jgi:hypothetical protein
MGFLDFIVLAHIMEPASTYLQYVRPYKIHTPLFNSYYLRNDIKYYT